MRGERFGFIVTILALSIVGVMRIQAQQTKATSSYPNELPGYKFYEKYLSPLRPHVSDKAAVVQVLGSDQGRTVDGWKMWPLYVADDGPAKGRLAEVKLIPQDRVSMRGVRFPPAFKHGMGSVSEINVTCDVYSDADGLQYWLCAEGSGAAKKGDLMQIVYGASVKIERQSASQQR